MVTQTILQIVEYIGGETGYLLFMVSVSDIKRRNANWIGHTLHGNYLLKDVTEGKRGVKGRRERR